VTLINTNGLAIFGPGSEWFWSMAQFIVVVVTLFAIYRQVRAQASANALGRLEALDRRWQGRLLTFARVRSAMSLQNGKAQPGMSHEMSQIAGFFVDLANLHEEGHISLKEIDDNWGMSIQVWVALLRHPIHEQRLIEGDPTFMAELERFAATLHARRIARGGEALVFDADSLPGWLDTVISRNIAGLELLRDAESGVIPRPPFPAPLAADVPPPAP
jgi:hypothetical protein